MHTHTSKVIALHVIVCTLVCAGQIEMLYIKGHYYYCYPLGLAFFSFSFFIPFRGVHFKNDFMCCVDRKKKLICNMQVASDWWLALSYC